MSAPAPTTVQKRAERQLVYKEKKKQVRAGVFWVWVGYAGEGCCQGWAPSIVGGSPHHTSNNTTTSKYQHQVGEWLPLVAAARQAESLNFSYEAPERYVPKCFAKAVSGKGQHGPCKACNVKGEASMGRFGFGFSSHRRPLDQPMTGPRRRRWWGSSTRRRRWRRPCTTSWSTRAPTRRRRCVRVPCSGVDGG